MADTNKSNTNKIMKFHPATNGKQLYHPFSTVKDTVLKKVQARFSEGHDVAKGMEEGVETDISSSKPTRKRSEKKKDEDREFEQQTMDLDYEYELKLYHERKDSIRKQGKQAYAMIIDNYCTTTMQQRIEGHPKFESTIKNNVIELMKAIQELTHDTVKAQHPFHSLYKVLKELCTLYQGSEHLNDLVRKIKEKRDILKAMLGTDILDEFIKNTAEYQKATTQQKAEMLKDGLSSFVAYILPSQSLQAPGSTGVFRNT